MGRGRDWQGGRRLPLLGTRSRVSPDSERGLVDGRVLGSWDGMGLDVGPQMRKKVCGMGTGLQESLNGQAEKLEGQASGKMWSQV